MEKDAIVSHILELQAGFLKRVESLPKKRSIFDRALKIVEEGEYFLGITGLRGIGKTVLLLQLARQCNGVYFSADSRELRGVDLYAVLKALSDAGHSRIFVDEIHAKPNWDADLKSVFDEKAVYVCFSGSSSIKLKNLKADLSRRAVVEHLKPASFREWLAIKKNIELPELPLDEIIKKKAGLVREFGFAHKYLGEYYRHGGVLYEAKTDFYKTILSTIETIASKDLSIIREVGPDIEESFSKLLYLIASSKPLELSYSRIGETLGKNKVWVMRFLSEIEKTESIKRVFPVGSGMTKFRKEAKYYLPFPYRASLCAVSGAKPDMGSLREEFFVNHVECDYIKTRETATADFRAANHSFEIGGTSKKNKSDTDYLATDSLDTSRNKIPLFLFGLTY